MPLNAQLSSPVLLSKTAVAPLQIDYADTVSAPVGAWVTLWGVSFGSSASAGTISLGSTIILTTNIRTWTDRRIDFKIPANAQSGFLSVQVGDQVSNTLYFTVRTGNIYYVTPGSAAASDTNAGTATKPWKTLARGVRDLKPGDTLYLCSATYRESLEPAAAGSLLLPIMIKTLPGQSAVLQTDATSGPPDAVVADGERHPGLSDLIFSGLTLRGSGNAIKVGGGAARCKFYGIDADASQTGLTIDGGNVGTLVAQCAFNNCAGFGVSMQNGVSGVILRDCTVSGSQGADGGFVADDTVTTITLARCLASKNQGDGFKLSAAGLTVNECYASQNANGMRIMRGARLQNCWVYGNQKTGIILGRLGAEKPAPELVNCTVAGPHAVASIDVAAGVGATLRNTVSVGSLGPAILFEDAAAKPVLDHVIVQTAGSDASAAIAWGTAGAGASAGKIGLSAGASGSGKVLLTLDLPSTLTVIGSPNALFQDYGKGDLRLIRTSPARGAGTIQDAPSYDYFRQLRGVSAGRVDVGAVEYSQPKSNAAINNWSMYE